MFWNTFWNINVRDFSDVSWDMCSRFYILSSTPRIIIYHVIMRSCRYMGIYGMMMMIMMMMIIIIIMDN